MEVPFVSLEAPSLRKRAHAHCPSSFLSLSCCPKDIGVMAGALAAILDHEDKDHTLGMVEEMEETLIFEDFME